MNDRPSHAPTGAGDDLATLRDRLLLAEAHAERLRGLLERDEWLASTVAEQHGRLLNMEQSLKAAQIELDRIRQRRALRYVDRAKRLMQVIGKRSGGGTALRDPTAVLREPSATFPEDVRYARWVELYDTVDVAARDAIRKRLSALASEPLVSVLLPVYNTPEAYLRAAIESVQAQLYRNWELCVADDCSTTAWIPKVLAEYAAADPRIRVTRRDKNGHISASSNTALAMARGDWVALFDHDDVLPAHALALSVLALAECPNAALLYSDEDHIDDEGNRSDPYFKPDYDPILLLGQNYFSHLCMLRRDLVEQVGGFRSGLEGSQDWDLVLRVTELVTETQVVHVPHVLYHWRAHPGSTASSLAAKPYAAVAAQRAVAEHLQRGGQRGRPLPIGGTGFNRVEWTLPESPPPVSVVVLPRNGERMVRCLDSVRVCSTYPSNIELIVVDDGGFRPPMRQFLRDRRSGITLVRVEGDHSDSALRNAGARAATGQALCFLDDDVEVLVDRWLEEMVGLLLQPDIGAVGAKLLYPDRSVQHAGIIAGIGGAVGHLHRFFDRLEPGYFGRAMLSQCFSAVSGACMVVRREAFDAVGGFDEQHLSGLFGDVDLCFRLGEAGWRTAWTPRAELLHFEAKEDARATGGENAVRFARELRYLQARWGQVLDRDPAYNPNLSLAHETAPLAFPPRASYR